MSKKNVSAAESLMNKVVEALNSITSFEEQELEDRLVETFKASGGKVIKKLMAADEKLACEILATINAANDITCRVSLPITMPLHKEDYSKSATSLLVHAQSMVPGNLSISQYGRLTLTYEVHGKADEIDTFIAELAWFLAEGNRTANWARVEFYKGSDKLKPFNHDKDMIWKSQMGEPVKLTPEALAMVAGGEFLKDFFVVVATLGGYAAGSVIGAPAVGVSGPIIAGAGGAAAGSNIASSVYGLKVVWCFAKDTSVKTLSGVKAIQDVTAGETVLGYDYESKTFVPTRVERLDVHNESVVVRELSLSDGSTFKVTDGHPFLTLNRGWLFGEELKVGDQILNQSGVSVFLTSTASSEVVDAVFNVVTECGTYLIGPNGLVCSGLTAQEAKSRNIV